MIRYLIKNNFKIMFRSVINLVLLTIAPVAVIAVLSSAFSSLMESYKDVEDFGVGYHAEGETVPREMLGVLTDIGRDNGIVFTEYKEAPEDAIRAHDLGGFVTFEGTAYTLYKNADAEAEGQLLEYFLHAFFENMSTALSEGGPPIIEKVPAERDFQTIRADFVPAIDSKDYYGIIYIIYFSWCAIVCGVGLFISEKKYRIGSKIRVSGISETQFYLGKFLPIVLQMSLGMGIATLLSLVLFGIHWGNALLSILLVFAGITAAVAMGLMIQSMFDNMVVTVIVVFMIVWVWGFLGGSFETYMFSEHSDFVKHLSPIYLENRAAVELSCMGHSDYVIRSLLVSGAITIVCSAFAILAGTIRKKGGRV